MNAKLLVLIAICAVASPLAAQEPETLVRGRVTSGGFGGPAVRVTQLIGQTGIMMGGRGGWIINHRFVVGGGGYGVIGSGIDVPYTPTSGGRAYLTFGYGGLELQYFERPMKLVHLTFATLVGVGGAEYRQGSGGQLTGSSTLLVVEPAAGVALNVTTKLRVNVGASYRYVSGVGLPGLVDRDLRGASASLGLDFGRF